MAAADVDLDLAVIGGGAAGTFVADAMQGAHPDWSIALFERTNRIGGRLRSLRIDGLDHPIELGGMRFLTSHGRVASVVESFALATRPFDASRGAPERWCLRGVVGVGDDTAEAGDGYDLPTDQHGRAALALAGATFEKIVPGFRQLDHDGHARWRASGRLLDRPVIDWSIGDALDGIIGTAAHQFVVDAFGYDSGMRAFCAPDLVEFLFGGGDPSAEAITPSEGMDRIPGALAARFEAAGGSAWLDHELVGLALDGERLVLTFANGRVFLAAKVVLTMPVPALRRLATSSPVLAGAPFARVAASVEAFPAMKLYLWYREPWWRPTVPGIRTTTDLELRKVFYFDGKPGSSSALLAMYTDGLDTAPWAQLHSGGAPGAPAPAPMLEVVQRQLREVHPEIEQIPEPEGSALMYWGADARETGWHFWRAGVNSDEILELAPQPDPALQIYLANEAFSRRQSWVEGALEAAEAAIDRLREAP